MDPDKLILRLLPILTSQMMTLSVTTITTEGQERGRYVPPTLGLGFQHSQWLPGTLFPPSKLQPVLRPFPLGFGFSWLLHTHTHLHRSSSSAQASLTLSIKCL